MTHEKFWELYDSNQITVKVFQGTDQEEQTTTDVEAFEYDGKFYLRVHTRYEYICDRHRINGKWYKMTRGSDYIKEFDTKQHANNYFKKAFSGLTRVV